MGAITPHLDHLRDLPFVQDAEIDPPNGHPTAVLRLRIKRKWHEFRIEWKRTHLTRALVDGVIAKRAGLGDQPWILFAPYVGRPTGKYLAEQHINYLDEAGNCRLQIDQDHVALIDGRRPPAAEPQSRGLGKAGYQVIFTLLAQPDLLDKPLRTIASAAGTSKNAAGTTLATLTATGLIAKGATRREIIDRQTMLDRWLTGYVTMCDRAFWWAPFARPTPTPRPWRAGYRPRLPTGSREPGAEARPPCA